MIFWMRVVFGWSDFGGDKIVGPSNFLSMLTKT